MKAQQQPPTQNPAQESIPTQQIQEININSVILSKFIEIIKEEAAGVMLFQNLWIQASGYGTFEIQSVAKREEKKSLESIKNCAKFAIILFGGEATQQISIIPCEETLLATNNAKGLRKAIELAYQWTMQMRSMYLNLEKVLRNEHPDIAEWGVLSAKEKLESFYFFQSLLS